MTRPQRSAFQLGAVCAKELALNVDGEIASPASDPDEVAVGAYRPVDQHERRRTETET